MRRVLACGLAFWLVFHGAGTQAAVVMQLTGMTDVNFPSWSLGDPALSASMDVCVYAAASLPSGGYAVTATAPGGFVLKSGAYSLPYNVKWDDSGAGNLGAISGASMANNIPLTGQVNANVASPLCVALPSGPNARLTIGINQTDLASALSGTYGGTLTLLLSPN